MSNDRFTHLVARKLSGEASEEESRELEFLLKDSAEAHYTYELLTEYWNIETSKKEDKLQEDIHFQQILAIAEKQEEEEKLIAVEVQEADKKPAGKIISFKKWMAAAVILLVTASVYYFYKSYTSPADTAPMAINEIETKKGTRSYLLLPDGTKVWLNADSRLEYNAGFNDSIREVILTGEAYFDVVRDEKRPFIVHTSDIDIRVLGTAFNVKSYPREDAIEATLIHGLIEVTNKKEPTSPKVILHPHEKLVFKKDCSLPANEVVKSKTIRPFSINTIPRHIADSAIVETSWIYNKLIFDGETFREIALKMERWYDVKFHFNNEKVASIPIHYTLANETVEEALKALQYIEDFTYKINGNTIEIY